MTAYAGRWTISAAALAVVAAIAAAREQEGAAPASPRDAGSDVTAAGGSSPKWVRIVESDEGVLRLALAARTYEPVDAASNSPEITLVSVMHIGDRAYYRRLQKVLDDHDLVLYEAVAPPGLGAESVDADDATAMAERTRARMRLLAAGIESEKRHEGAYPASLAALGESVHTSRRLARWLNAAGVDAWGRSFVYVRSEDGAGFELKSLGADGREGGEGAGADIDWSSEEPLTPQDLAIVSAEDEEHQIQAKLARAFDLAFQLDEIDYERDNWRNSDMGVDELMRRLEASGADGGVMLDLLSGSSFPARVASMVLSLVEMIPGAAPRGKLMLIELLGSSDDLLAATGPMAEAEALMKVIVDDRNQVVIDDLRKVLDSGEMDRSGSGAPRKRVAVFYGAGHMPDLADRLEKDLGFRDMGAKWYSAIRLDLAEEGISESEVLMVRGMVRRQLEMMKSMSDGE